MDELRPDKPLGMKSYGSIPHLPGSRLGPGDHHCSPGQANIATLKKRDRHDRVTVTVKLDGSCCAVANINGEIVALGRAGHRASTSKYEQHQFFALWVRERAERFRDILGDGERIVGEWLAQAHSTRYELRHEPFVPFDLMAGPKRFTNEEMIARAERGGFTTPHQIRVDGDPTTIEDAMTIAELHHHGELDPVEGCVWRVERKGEFDFLAKFVREGKVDGMYLPEISGGEAVWNWRPAAGERGGSGQ